MVTIRLSRGGAKKRPFYAILVADQRRALRGRFIERIGFYNPIAAGGEQTLRVDLARAQYWLDRGAQPSARVVQLCKQAEAIAAGETPKVKKDKGNKQSKKAAAKLTEKQAAETQATETTAADAKADVKDDAKPDAKDDAKTDVKGETKAETKKDVGAKDNDKDAAAKPADAD